jgi:nucleoside-diphosphate-sugar epimerase
MSKFLITGARGFVGSHLYSRLLKLGFDTQTLNFSQTLLSDSKSRSNAGSNLVDQLMGAEVIIHLAARVHVMTDKSLNPLEVFMDVNFLGTAKLARQAAISGVKRFVYVSSIKVNGEHTDEEPFTERSKPNPQDPYGISKWEAERALHEISGETGMELVIVRPPLVYGPGVKANFYNLLQLVNKALPLPLGSIKNRRSMVYVENLVDALILCATNPKAAGQTYLLSDGHDVSTPQLISDIALAMRRPSRVFPFSLSLIRLGAKLLGRSTAVDRLTQSLEIDSSKIRDELGWQPPYTMEQGLQATADWFTGLKNRPKAK